MNKHYSRREILRAIMLGGGIIAGELWWPGQKLISIPSTEEVLRYTAMERYSYGYTDGRAAFGSVPIKPEGQRVLYDQSDPEQVAELKRQARLLGSDHAHGERLDFNADSLEQLVVDIRRGGGPEAMPIKPRKVKTEGYLVDPADWFIRV